ncbi:MAG: sigma-70 family RNA polymerase sigma factor, partial [Candidatus Magasanikbacteria bacterium]|nr:sigma-70 family RNA polymerase sigma factor [Candidatus Magasanikbacteria bacterium]
MAQTPSNFTDEQLVAHIREKDKELYSEIIRRYETKLSHYLRKFFRNPDELEDVLQEVFIKVYRNLYGFDVDKKFSSWIYRITHNEAINHLKKNYRKNISLDETEWDIVDE